MKIHDIGLGYLVLSVSSEAYFYKLTILTSKTIDGPPGNFDFWILELISRWLFQFSFSKSRPLKSLVIILIKFSAFMRPTVYMWCLSV